MPGRGAATYRWILGWMLFALAGVLLAAATAHAGILDTSWTAPTMNVDGTPLTDLASYRVYYGVSNPPCPGSSYLQVASSTSTPAANQTVSASLTGLSTGSLYYVAVTAVDTGGSESSCSPLASATARGDFSVSPTATMDFGTASIGSFVDRTFTVQNTTGGTVSGTASSSTPFSVVSGSSFSLVGVGTTQAVTVRFSPTVAATASVNLTVTANGASVTRQLTGLGATDATPPTVAIATPTSTATYSTTSSTMALGGTASDNVGVTQVTWANNRGGSGTATGTTSWTASGIALQPGANVLTITARDAAGNNGTATLTATMTDTTPPTVALTAPAAGTVSGVVNVTATASDNVGVAGVQFKVDGANLGAEKTAAPYSVSWTTTTAANGSHTVTAVARDASSNSTTSTAVIVTVSNDTTPPLISAVSASGISSSAATITWTTDEASDSQAEYGLTAAYGSAAPLAASLVASHSQTLSGLAAGTLYHYRVKSRDAAGNLATSGDVTFVSLPASGSGLVGYWTFDAGSGTTAADSSGNGNTGTLVNGPTWTSGKLGQALAFDGLSNYVNVPHAGALDAYPLTIATWIKTAASTGARGIVNKYVAGTSNGYQLFLNNGSLCAWYFRDASNYVYDNGTCTLSTAGYADNQWHHVAFVVDASGGRLYVDGLQTATLGWTGISGAPTTTQPVHIGDYAGATGGLFSGLIDDARIYNRALSGPEISTLYSSGSVGAAAPMQSSIAASALSPTGATISWMTDVTTTSQIEYGLTTGYGSATPVDTSLVTSHSKPLSGLASGTAYHFRVKSWNTTGGFAVSADSSFRTADAPVSGPTRRKHKRSWFESLLNFF